VRALLWPLFSRSAWAQPATVVAGTTGEGASVASDRYFSVGRASHCCVDQDRRGRCSFLYSLGRRGLSQQLCGRALQVRALLWPLFAR
jgi:hypothetical protein